MSNENEKKDNRSAAQRLTDLEAAVGQLYGAVDSMTRDLSMLKNVSKLLDNKLNALIKATVDGEKVSDEVIDRIMVENNIADLANKVTNMVVNGIVTKEEQVSGNSFVVGSESDETGKVVNPRIQFALRALAPELQAKIVGAKPGDSIVLQEGKFTFKLLESYKIVDVAPEATPEESSEASEQPEAAPAAEQASSSESEPQS